MLRVLTGPMPAAAEGIPGARLDRGPDTLILLNEDLPVSEQRSILLELLREPQDRIA